MCWVPQCSTTLLPAVLHTFTVTFLYAPTDISLSTSFIVSQVEWSLWVLLHETGSNASLTNNYLTITAFHSSYSSAVPWTQDILSTSSGLQTWIKINKSTYFWPNFQPENKFFCWDLVLPNGNFHIYSFFFLSVILYLLFCICLVPAVFQVILKLTINF